MSDTDIAKYLSPRQALNILWDRGLSGVDLLREHSAFMDTFITSKYEALPEELRKGTALLALGGYGREEHFPFSDVDLMVLHLPEVADNISRVSEQVFYPLWDSGLDVGHGVRSVDDCLVDAADDFFFQVALLDARLVCGDRGLFDSLMQQFSTKFIEGRRSEFVSMMMDHRNERHRRFGDHTYLLEPNIKEGRGGFRDFQSIMWTSKVMFGISSFPGLVEEGLILEDEGEQVTEALNTLIRIRNSLHYESGRKNDRLYFEYQEEIARKLRHYDSSSMLGVESFMGNVYKCMESIALVSDIFFEHVDDTLNGHIREPGETLDHGIELIGSRLHVTSQEVFMERPSMLIRVFELAALHNVHIHYRARRIISSCADLASTGQFRNSRNVAQSFIKVLNGGEISRYLLEVMLETGIISSYLPEFEHITALAQHDIYHTVTVDHHLIQTVFELHKLQDEFSFLFEGINRDILMLAGFMHDIGKGLGGRHASRGAEMAEAVGKRMGLPRQDQSTLRFLVRNHLFLVDVAVRRDLEDESLIVKCARRIKEPCRLRMLVLITIADSRATGPGVWNEWKAALLMELYHKIVHLLEQPEIVDPEREQAVEWMREQVVFRLQERKPDRVQDLPEDYLLSFTPDAVIQHMDLVDELVANRKDVIILPEDRGSYWSLLFVAKDRTGLLARIFGLLSLHNMSVMNAQIFTLPGGIAIDAIDVRSAIGQKFTEFEWHRLEKELVMAIERRLAISYRLDEKFGASCRRSKGSVRPVKAVVENESSDFFTIIEVYSDESPVTLYRVTDTLADFGINIYKAKIGTKADQSVEAFYVLDHVGEKIEDRELVQEIRNALVYAADVACGN